ncbi:peptidylprolyl isomerase [Spiroplasma cantharicola]|uniref:Peptidyl-prolyl cis-trans isomerase n=1 Tax=Spiroplasma cantharicola TaxID=362837 RepID=A0A0M4JRT2_9MOLU|nr:peptidylprolyl isomerase [Spiroplasma cantharicola]ALD65946.1 peptidyl-prolyl cis-trans isomerase [Spiroplasma cantharicola]
MKIIKFEIILKDGKKMQAELFPELAPISVENFVNLIKNKYFDGLIFHRVIKDFMIQGGGMDVKMNEKGGLEPIKGEFSINGWNKNATNLKHLPGVLSMARTNDMNSATSQFFIVTGDASFLDGQYASFGKLSNEESLKIALEISNCETTTHDYHDDVPTEPIIIETMNLI